MGIKEALREVRSGFEGSGLGHLEDEANNYLSSLMEERLAVDEFVREDLITFLALKVLICEKRIEVADDVHERVAFEALKNHYSAIFYNADGIDGHACTYCADQVRYYEAPGYEKTRKRWSEIFEAMSRVIRGETALDKQIAVEIAERSGDDTFLPDMWRRCRKDGWEPSEIDHDMCHMKR